MAQTWGCDHPTRCFHFAMLYKSRLVPSWPNENAVGFASREFFGPPMAVTYCRTKLCVRGAKFIDLVLLIPK